LKNILSNSARCDLLDGACASSLQHPLQCIAFVQKGLLFCAQDLWTQPCKISGRQEDKNSELPMQGVRVYNACRLKTLGVGAACAWLGVL